MDIDDEVEERLAATGELVAGIAHEIASPLTYVLGNALSAIEEIQRPRFDVGELHAMLVDIKEGAERLRDVARDLRTLSSTASLHESFDLGEAMYTALRIVAAPARGALRVSTKMEPARVCGSPGRLTQAFVDLFISAAKAAKASGTVMKLAIELTHDETDVVLRVDGPGTPSALVHGILRAHGGSIERNEGRLTLRFPRANQVSSAA